ncbi:MAG: LuxR C-terminal-related transcriptional regulator [Acidimicrobiales bacterium]
MGAGPTQQWSLIGRDEERDQARASLRRDGTGGVLITGSQGVGKTSLARALADGLRAVAGNHVEWIVGSASGRSIPFGAFGPLVPEVGGERKASEEPFDLLQNLRRALIGRAGGERLFLGVDDAHRLDPSSATLLFQLVSAGSAQVVATMTSGAPAPEALRALWKEGFVDRVDLGPLARDDTLQLAGRLLEGNVVDGELGEKLWELSGGNPLYLRELVWAARDAGAVIEDSGTWSLQGELVIGPRIVEIVHDRLGRLSPGERAALELVAFAAPLPMAVLHRLARSSHIIALQRHGLLAMEVSHGAEHARAYHPLYGEVVRAALPPSRAAEIRLDLAGAFENAGLTAANLLRVVTWRLDAGSPPALDVLLEATDAAVLREDWALAVHLSAAALDAGAGRGASLVQAEALNRLGRHDDALLALGEWEGDSDNEIARVAVLRAHILNWGLDRAFEAGDVLTRAESRISGGSDRAWMAASRAALLNLAGHPRRAVEQARPLLGRDDLSTAASAAVHSALALGLAWSGQPDQAVSLAYEQVARATRLGEPPPRWTVMTRLNGYRAAGRIAEVWSLAESEYQAALRLHDRPGRGVAAGALGWACLARGPLGEAVAYFRESLGALERIDPTGTYRECFAGLGEALSLSGDARAARSVLAEAVSGMRTATAWMRPRLALAGAWVAAAEGETTRALREAARTAAAARERGQVSCELLALHTSARLGSGEGAGRLAELASWVEGPLVHVAAAHAAALAASSGESLDQVAEGYAAMTCSLYAAEAAAQASRAHDHAGLRRLAAASAVRARSLAGDSVGPHPLTVSTSLAPPALTRREQEVATLAAHGDSNQGIAERLSLSVRTVESHLARAYYKLGVNTRADLSAALGLREARSR